MVTGELINWKTGMRKGYNFIPSQYFISFQADIKLVDFLDYHCRSHFIQKKTRPGA